MILEHVLFPIGDAAIKNYSYYYYEKKKSFVFLIIQ